MTEYDDKDQKINELSAELARTKRRNETLERERRRVGLTFRRVPESGYQLARLWDGDFPILTKVPRLSLEKTPDDPTYREQGNTVLIEGDNFAALSALMLTHRGKIDVIYIDPPYNTGNNDFVYNDARKSSIADIEGANLSEYERTLDGKTRVVGKDDPERHSLWLSFMEKRLFLAKELLTTDGVIFVSIDDNEQARLKLLMDDVFGSESFISNVIWQSRNSVSNDSLISMNHNSTLIYAKNPTNLLAKAKEGKVFRKKIDSSLFSNPDNDSRGPWKADPFDAPNFRANLNYPITNPNTGQIFYPPKGRCWRTTQEEYERLLVDNRIIFGKNGKTKPQLKRFFKEAESKGSTLTTVWSDIGTTTDGSNTVKQIFGELVFSNPKPVSLIKRIIEISNEKLDATVLDFFAGSGTTAHAVALLNAEDGGNRTTILVTNNENQIAETVTAERMRRVLSGKNWADNKEHESLPGGLYYYKIEFASKTSNPMHAVQILQSRFDGLASFEQNAHAEIDRSKDWILLRNNSRIVLVWQNEETLLYYSEEELFPLLTKLERQYNNLERVIYVPSSSDDVDEYGLSESGWVIYPYPVEYIRKHNALMQRLRENKTFLQPLDNDSKDSETWPDSFEEKEEAN